MEPQADYRMHGKRALQHIMLDNARNECRRRAFLLKEETMMEILHLMTPFDYALVVVLGAVLVFSLMEGGSHKH
jgi:hypothetical protein